MARLCVRDGPDGTERILIDPEKFPAPLGSHNAISYFAPSDDSKWVAASRGRSSLGTRLGGHLAKLIAQQLAQREPGFVRDELRVQQRRLALRLGEAAADALATSLPAFAVLKTPATVMFVERYAPNALARGHRSGGILQLPGALFVHRVCTRKSIGSA